MIRLAAIAAALTLFVPVHPVSASPVLPTDYFTAFSHCLQVTTYDGCIGITSAEVDAGTISEPSR